MNGHVASLPNGDLLEGFDGEDEVGVGGVAMAAGDGREAVIGGAEVGGGDDDGGAGDAPTEILHAPDLEAGSADLPSLEHCAAQPRRRHSVPTLHQVAVPTCSSHRVTGIRRRVVGGVCGSPLCKSRASSSSTTTTTPPG